MMGIGLYRTLIQRKTPYIRRFPVLDAIYEGIGRALETGKKFHFGIPTTLSLKSAETLAGVSILSDAVRKSAAMGVPSLFTCNDPVVLTIMEGTVRDAYAAEGKLEAFYDPNMVQFRLVGAGTEETYPTYYAMMLSRENIGSSVLVAFGKPTLLLGEANREAGTFAIQLAPDYDKIEWGIATFDYSLILQENYVAAASLKKDPAGLGTAIGVDIATWVSCALIIIFTVVASVLGTSLTNILVG
jgi:hypothetical protein